MKKLFVITLSMFFSVYLYAQPSDATMLAKIKSDTKNLISANLEGKGIAEKEYENNAWQYYYRKSYRTKAKTQHAGISYNYYGGIQYIKNGGSYVFDRFLIGDGYYEGVPNPDKAEIEKILKTDLKKFLNGYHYNKIVGDLSEISFPADPEWRWHTLKSVSFNMKVTYSEPISYTDVETAEHTYNVRLYSDEFKGPWKNFISSEKQNLRKQIELKKYTADEVRAMKTLQDVDAENIAKAEMGNLPTIGEIPAFESDKQLFYFVHDIIMTKSADEIKAYLYKVIANSAKEQGSDILLTNYAQGWVDKVIKNEQIYKKTHCPYPTIKAQQANMITWYDKENRRMLRYTGALEDNIWKLTLINYYPAKSDEVTRMESLATNCQEKPNLTVRKIISYKVGDKVKGKFSNGTFPSSITKLDPQNKNRYFIKLDNDNSGKGYWIDEKFLEPNTGGSANSTNNEIDNSTQNKTQQIFKVGDKVKIKTTKGLMKAKILKKSNNKYLVHFNLPVFKDTWVPAHNIVKY